MRLDDEVQVATFSLPPDDQSVYRTGVPIEMGGRGAVVRLWAVHYHMYYLNFAATLGARQALSENPEHEFRAPVTSAEFSAHKALYGRAIWDNIAVNQGAGQEYERSRLSRLVPLYGILRARRQIWVNIFYQGGGLDMLPCIEVYYSPVNDLPRQIINTVNRTRGKYRRT